MYNLLSKYSQVLTEILPLYRKTHAQSEAEKTFYSISVPIFVIICCVGLIFGALHRMKKAKELYELSDDLAPPPEGRNKRIIALSAVTIFLCVADYSIKFTSNGFAMIFGIILLFILGTMSTIDTTDGYTCKQNRYRITKLSEPLPWDYGENKDEDGTEFVVDKQNKAYWVNYEKARFEREEEEARRNKMDV
jgi:hypothetical protein